MMSTSLAALLMLVVLTLAFEILVLCNDGRSPWGVAARMLQAFAILWVITETMRP